MSEQKTLPRFYTRFGPVSVPTSAQFLYTVKGNTVVSAQFLYRLTAHHAQNLCTYVVTICFSVFLSLISKIQTRAALITSPNPSGQWLRRIWRRVRAERKCGELLAQLEKGKKTSTPNEVISPYREACDRASISKDQASNYQNQFSMTKRGNNQ